MQRHTTPRGPDSVPTETQSGSRVDYQQDPALLPQRWLQKVVMNSQARAVVVGGGMVGGEPNHADGTLLESETAYDPKNERLRA
jgi:hypothetical protein